MGLIVTIMQCFTKFCLFCSCIYYSYMATFFVMPSSPERWWSNWILLYLSWLLKNVFWRASIPTPQIPQLRILPSANRIFDAYTFPSMMSRRNSYFGLRITWSTNWVFLFMIFRRSSFFLLHIRPLLMGDFIYGYTSTFQMP